MSDKETVHFARVAPIFPVTNIRDAIEYYTQTLQFSVDFEWSDTQAEPVRYAVLNRDTAEIHLTQTQTAQKAAAYFLVDNVRAYYDAIHEAGAKVTHALKDQPWGMHECEVADLDGNILIFGEPIDTQESAGA